MIFLSNLIYASRNVIANTVFLLLRFYRIRTALRWLRFLRARITNPVELKFQMATLCKYKREGWDWKPWVITFIVRGFRDDCDAYANFARYFARKNGWKPEYYSVYGDGWGHATCVFTYLGKRYIAGTKGVREFHGWEHHFPGMTKKVKRW